MALFRKKERGGGPGGGAKAGRKGFERLDARTRAITFYAEDGGSWPHLGPIVTELTDTHGRDVAYLTSSPSDPVLALDHPRLHAFEIGEGLGRSFLFQTMEVGVLVATVPQLGIPVLPRSRRAAALGTQYVYVFHSMASTHMIYEPDGFDHYDTVLCVGPYMVDEVRRREELHGLAAKELVEHGYARLDAILVAAAARGTGSHPADPPVVLVAPSWGPTCIFETCGKELVGSLLDAGYEVVARPHPMTARKTPAAIPALRDAFAGHPRFTLETDVTGSDSLHRSDLMVSDWSGAALEYALGLERPVLFVDVDRKVNNPAYTDLGIEPFEVAVRERVGRIVSPDDLGRAPGLVDELVRDAPRFVESARAVRAEHVANVGRSAAVAAEVVVAKADAYLARLGAAR